MHHLLRVVNESDMVRADKALEEVHPLEVLVSSVTRVIRLRNLTFPATQASPGYIKPFLVFANIISPLFIICCTK